MSDATVNQTRLQTGLTLATLVCAALCTAFFFLSYFFPNIESRFARVPNGTYIGILAALLGSLAVLEGPKSRWGRASTILIIFTLLYFELKVLKNDQIVAEGRYQGIMDHFTKVQGDISNYNTAQTELFKSQLKSLNPVAERMSATTTPAAAGQPAVQATAGATLPEPAPPSGSLRVRALALASELSAFLMQRNSSAPSPTDSRTLRA